MKGGKWGGGRPKSHGDSDCILQEWDDKGCLLVPGMKCEGWEGPKTPLLITKGDAITVPGGLQS